MSVAKPIYPVFESVAIEQVVPLFVITNYPSSIQAAPSSTITINVTIANNGKADGTVEVRIKDHNGNVVASKQADIAVGSSQTISITATAPSSPGTYNWLIEAYNTNTTNIDDSKSFTIEVTGFNLQQLTQMITQLLPLIITILMIVLIVSLLAAAFK